MAMSPEYLRKAMAALDRVKECDATIRSLYTLDNPDDMGSTGLAIRNVYGCNRLRQFSNTILAAIVTRSIIAALREQRRTDENEWSAVVEFPSEPDEYGQEKRT